MNFLTWAAKRRWQSRSMPKSKRVCTLAMSPVGVHRRETMSSEVLAMLRAWLLRPDHKATLASSAGMDCVLDAGTTRVASSAYLEKAFPGVTALRSDVLM